MSVRERLEDAQLLYRQDRAQGALLSVLVAVAATSRKRRPRPEPDRSAFIEFLGEEMLAITNGAVLNYNIQFRGQKMPLQEFFYTFLRCELAHEGALPSDVQFAKPEQPGSVLLDITESHLRLSHNWMDGLVNTVQYAPENSPDFPELAGVPPDVIKWFLFGRRRDGPHVAEYWERRGRLAEEWLKKSSPEDE